MNCIRGTKSVRELGMQQTLGFCLLLVIMVLLLILISVKRERLGYGVMLVCLECGKQMKGTCGFVWGFDRDPLLLDLSVNM